MSFTSRVLKGLVLLYQAARLGRPSPCRFTPSCSNYALDALEAHGALEGLRLTISRLFRCQPWGPWGSDPIPDAAATRTS